MPLVGAAAVIGATGSRYERQLLPSSYQKAPRTEVSDPIHHVSMVVLMRDTAAEPARRMLDPIGPGSRYGPCHPWPSSYQNPPCTTLSGPVHQTSMLSRNRDRALISLSGEAEPGRATSYRSQPVGVATH